MNGSLLLHNLKLNCLIFSTGLNSSLIILIQTYTVNYRNALDRLHVRMNIILLYMNFKCTLMLVGGCNFAQLTAYFNHVALQAVHYFAETWKLAL